MTSTETNQRSWDFTPPPIMNRIMTLLLQTPLLHRLVSSMLLLITFTGRKSSKTYKTPVGYHQEGDEIFIMTKRFRNWWHNFEDLAPVELQLKGNNVEGTAHALTDVDKIVPIIARLVAESPREAEIYRINMVDGKPDIDSVRKMAPKLVVIRIGI